MSSSGIVLKMITKKLRAASLNEVSPCIPSPQVLDSDSGIEAEDGCSMIDECEPINGYLPTFTAALRSENKAKSTPPPPPAPSLFLTPERVPQAADPAGGELKESASPATSFSSSPSSFPSTVASFSALPASGSFLSPTFSWSRAMSDVLLGEDEEVAAASSAHCGEDGNSEAGSERELSHIMGTGSRISEELHKERDENQNKIDSDFDTFGHLKSSHANLGPFGKMFGAEECTFKVGTRLLKPGVNSTTAGRQLRFSSTGSCSDGISSCESSLSSPPLIATNKSKRKWSPAVGEEGEGDNEVRELMIRPSPITSSSGNGTMSPSLPLPLWAQNGDISICTVEKGQSVLRQYTDYDNGRATPGGSGPRDVWTPSNCSKDSSSEAILVQPSVVRFTASPPRVTAKLTRIEPAKCSFSATCSTLKPVARVQLLAPSASPASLGHAGADRTRIDGGLRGTTEPKYQIRAASSFPDQSISAEQLLTALLRQKGVEQEAGRACSFRTSVPSVVSHLPALSYSPCGHDTGDLEVSPRKRHCTGDDLPLPSPPSFGRGSAAGPERCRGQRSNRPYLDLEKMQQKSKYPKTIRVKCWDGPNRIPQGYSPSVFNFQSISPPSFCPLTPVAGL